MGIFASLVPEVNAGVSFVGILVGRESDISVYPEKRTAICFWNGLKVWADRMKQRGEVTDEFQERIFQNFHVPGFIRIKPIPVIIRVEITKKRK